MSELLDNKLMMQPLEKNFSPGKEEDKYTLVPHTQLPDLKSDYLPDDILMSLTQRAGTRMSLAPPLKLKGKCAKPANVWNHSERREKLKHLTQSTACICGAGRDISFLYDIPPPENVKIKAPEIDPSAIRMRSRDQRRVNKTDVNVPDTLIPEEFHLVKSKGVIGLEYHDEKFSTNPVDHEKHLTIFPSLKPTSRFEVIKLRETMEKMLLKAGVDDFSNLDTSPSQMHALLSLVKKEQDIYNIIFHELIRQTTVECIEKGELLANLRQRYSNLLSKIPEQVKSLHDEVVAQRALDRRLTEELMRFKSTIGVLTSELADVKKHEESVSKDIHASKDEMKRALEDAKRNADLLSEYHTLYELQRRRLEDQVGILTDEKEMWSSAAYCLAMKVTEEYRLITARRLHIAEKSWNELARHFTVLLSDIDTTDLTHLQAVVNEWREHAERFSEYLQKREVQLIKKLESIQNGVKQFIEYFQDEFLSPDGHLLKVPKAEDVFQIIYNWEKLLSEEAEAFGGDTMLNMQENLSKMRRLVIQWTDGAIKIFQRHSLPAPNVKQPVPSPELAVEEEVTSSPNVQEMHRVNGEVEELLRQFNTRLTGDNGVAQHILTVQNILESWHTRLAAVIHGQSKPLPDSEWSRLYALLPDWVQLVQEIVVLVGRVEREEDSKANVERAVLNPTDTMIETQKWASLTNATIDSANGRQMETVTQLHTQMIHWMVQVLLRVAPNHPSSTPEGRMNVLLASASIGELKQSAKILFERVEEFTASLVRSCSTIISEMTQLKADRHEEDAEVEANEMRRFQAESTEWTTAAKLLLHEMLSGEVSMDTTPVLSTASTGVPLLERVPSHPFESTPDGTQEPKDLYTKQKESNFERAMQQPQLEAISLDGNTHTRILTQGEYAPPMATREGLEELERTVETPNTERAYEALAAVKQLQTQLRQAEERAQASESETLQLRIQLSTSDEKAKNLEEKMIALQRDLDNLIREQKEQDPLPNLLFRSTAQPAVQPEKEKTKTTTSSEQSKASRGRGGGTSRR